MLAGHSLLVAALLTTSVMGCRQDVAPLPPPPMPPVAAPVRILVDGAVRATVSPTMLATWPRLDTLLQPPANDAARWQTLALVGGKPLAQLSAPATSYPGLVAALYPGPDGPAFGLFEPAALRDHGAPKVMHGALGEIRVLLRPSVVTDKRGSEGGGQGGSEGGGGGDGGGRRDPGPITLDIRSTTRTVTLTGAQIDALPKITAPQGDSNNPGWSLVDLLHAAGMHKLPPAITLVDESGATLTMRASDLDPATGLGFIKLNRQGQLRFKAFRKVDGAWQETGDLRGLRSVQATATP